MAVTSRSPGPLGSISASMGARAARAAAADFVGLENFAFNVFFMGLEAAIASTRVFQAAALPHAIERTSRALVKRASGKSRLLSMWRREVRPRVPPF